MESVSSPYFDPEYENLDRRLNPPSVSIDNDTCLDYTLIKVDSANKHGILLEVVQLLTDLDLTISKAYISSDGGWFMDVFHVTDQLGNKLTDGSIIEYIQQSLGSAKHVISSREVKTCLGRTVGIQSIGEYTAIEMTGTDRPGLLSEISAVLTSFGCNVVAAESWTHNMRVACVVCVTDKSSNRPIEDVGRLSTIKEQLSSVLKGSDDSSKGVKTDFSMGLTHRERRLHQLMFADRDYECSDSSNPTLLAENRKPVITIENCNEKGYSVVNIQCRDRPKLVFDTVCTLTDMQYVVFHASIRCDSPYALQEYYIRHMDGCILDTEGEKHKVVKCLKAAIGRRASEGLSLELRAIDRIGLLSDVTRMFRENGLSVTRADVTTRGDKAMNIFYVRDASSRNLAIDIDMKVVEAMRKEIGHTMFLQAKNMPGEIAYKSLAIEFRSKFRFSLASLFKAQLDRLSYSFGMIKF